MGNRTTTGVEGMVAEVLTSIGRLRRIAFDTIATNWLIMTTGSMLRLAIGLIASVLVARTLGPVDLGVYATLAAIAATLGAMTEFGLTESAVRRVALNWSGNRQAAGETAATFVWLRTGLAASIVVVAIALIAVGAMIGTTPISPTLLTYALLGIVATALCGSTNGLLQATGRFGRLSVVLVVNSALTAVLALLLRATGALSIATAIIVLGIATSVASFALGRVLLGNGLRLALPPKSTLRREAGELLRFGRWLWLANTLAMLAAQLDLLLAARWLTPLALGAYALAVSLASKAAVVNQSLHAALLPVASSLRSSEALRTYLRRSMIRSLIVAAAFALLTPLARMLIPLIFGSDYRPAVDLFTALLGVAIVDLLATPILMLAYTVNRPRLIAAADACRVLALLLCAVALLPLIGVYGLVVAKLLASLAGLAVTAIALAQQSRRSGLQPDSASSVDDLAIQGE